MTFLSHSEAETQRAGELLGRRLCAGSIVALFGDVGAGKTVFVRGLTRGLGIHARVTSPTFSIVNEYDGPVPLFHFDMYRLSGPDELFDIGWEDYLARAGVCAVEWSENVASALGDDCIRVTIDKCGEDDSLRRISIEGPALSDFQLSDKE